MLTVNMLIMLMYILYRGHVCCPLSHVSFFLLQNISKLMTFLFLACNAGIPVFFGQVNVACCNMASRETSFSRTEIQQEIKKHGDVLRQLKLKEPTDEVKNKVTL